MTRPLPDAEPPDFEAFARAHAVRLRRLVARRLGDLGDAECVAQETLLRAHRHWAEFADEPAAAAWTTVVASRLAVDHLRLRGRAVPVGDVSTGDRPTRDTADVVVARAEARTALAALSAVPGRQAAVLWARQVEGLSYDEIAERHGLSEPTVRSLLHRGRKALRREYAARGGTLPGVAALLPLPELLRRLRRLPSTWVGGAAAVTAALGVATAVVLPAAPAPDAVELPSVRVAAVQDGVPRPATASVPGPAPDVPVVPAPPPAAAPASRPGPAVPALVDVLPQGCTERSAAVGACTSLQDVPRGGVTVSLPVPVPALPSELSTGVLGDCPPGSSAVCRPSGDTPPPAKDLP